ncbi:MAG: trypsin-like peptidase domain-containing protein [Verrucomicrobia bacterium]|nr:trypsin-like peptidase domain-containing protein [Verrucomicrobiota bacterium]
MKTRLPVLSVAMAALLAVNFASAQTEEASQVAARKLLADKGDSVVWLTAVMKISMTAAGSSDGPMNIPDRERKIETLATIIDSSGLLVTAMSQVDPSREMEGREYNTAKGPVRFDVSATLKEIKVVLQDGTEIPAEQVMKDSDLDLAFFRVKADSKEAQEVKFKALDLTDSGKVKLSDEVVTLSRTEEILNRVPAVTRGQVTSITEKPRIFVRATSAQLGCPTFTLDGKLVGLGVSRYMRGKSSVLIVLPAADVQEIALQAAKAKPLAAASLPEPE